MLVAVLVPHIGITINGARRWLYFGFQFQPSELLKLALVMYLAAWFATKEKTIHHITQSIAPLLIILSFMVLLVIMQPDMGTLSILVLIALAMYFFAGAKISHFAVIFGFLGIAMIVLALVSPYRFNRIKTFLDPSHDTQGVSYHINQALIGIGAGGFFGRGLGHSVQKLSYLPEPVGDSIFAIAIEELGFLGACVLVGLFVGLALCGVAVAVQTHDMFGKLLVLGCMVWIFGQAMINMAAISGIIPLTGLPLPFVSYGSSSLISLLAALGIVTNIAQEQG
jgi:cell division protein FtsW